MNSSLQQEIEALRRLPIKQLKIRYCELFGEKSPSGNHAHLFRRVAWRLQAGVHGDLSERARQQAAQLADDRDLRLRAPGRFWQELAARDGKDAGRDRRLPATGTVLERLYRGQCYQVRVLAEGFELEGHHYRSLSAAALHITGTRWNGFKFFGLTQGAAETL